MKKLTLKSLFCALLTILPLLASEGTITTWVPWWSVAQCKGILMDTTHRAGERIDRLGLPFWAPEVIINGEDTIVSGEIILERNQWHQGVDSLDIVWYRDWTRENNVACLLTIGYWLLMDDTMSTETWAINWELQKRAFADKKDVLVKALLDKVEEFDLDGVDVDLEGTPTYREEYAAFVRTLADSLHSRGKIMTLDVMPSTVGMNSHSEWWPDYLGYADALNIMAYQFLFEGSNDNYGGNLENNRYSTLIEYGISLGYRPEQLCIGLPTWLNDWGEGGHGTSSLAHLKELRDIETPVSVCLWDLRLLGKSWQDPRAWQTFDLLDSAPKIVLDSIDRAVALKDTDTLSLSWKLPEETAHAVKVISVRTIDSLYFEWRTVDTIAAAVEGYALPLSTIGDTLFTVMVEMFDTTGALIDYDIAGTYLPLEQTTPVLTTMGSDTQKHLSFSNNSISINLPQAGRYTVSLFSMNGREVSRYSGEAVSGALELPLPAGIAAGNYIVQMKTASFQEARRVSVR